MTRLAIRVIALSGLLLAVATAGCGRYGKPVRSAPAPDQSEQLQGSRNQTTDASKEGERTR